jgi:hypothetical protein
MRIWALKKFKHLDLDIDTENHKALFHTVCMLYSPVPQLGYIISLMLQHGFLIRNEAVWIIEEDFAISFLRERFWEEVKRMC